MTILSEKITREGFTVIVHHSCIEIYSSLDNGDLFRRRYIDYTRKEAIDIFRQELKENSLPLSERSY